MDASSHFTRKVIENQTADEILIASTEKKQRKEVKLSTLNPEELQAFEKAKENEVQNWISTGTVSRILRAKLAPEQILRCRWTLVWKPLEEKAQLFEGTKSPLELPLKNKTARVVSFCLILQRFNFACLDGVAFCMMASRV